MFAGYRGRLLQVEIRDDTAGHAVGWNPNGATTSFTISPAPGVTSSFAELLVVNATFAMGPQPSNCQVTTKGPESFGLTCVNPPQDGGALDYLRVNLPTQLIS